MSSLCGLISAETGVQAVGNVRPEQPLVSGSARKNNFFGFGGEIGYAAPYIWRGIQLTSGPCIQPELWISLWEIRAGLFINMFGSNKDREIEKIDKINLIIDYATGEGSQSFGMINKVNLFLDWQHSFNEHFSLYAAYNQYAYAEHEEYNFETFELSTRYEWFHPKSTNGEITIRPALHIGLFEIFTEQNVVIFASEYTMPGYLDTFVINDLGNYHSTYGIALEKRASDRCAVSLALSEDLAGTDFISKMIKIEEDIDVIYKGLQSWGFYQTTCQILINYCPRPWLALRMNAGYEFITNHNMREVLNNKSPIIFGGVHTTYTF